MIIATAAMAAKAAAIPAAPVLDAELGLAASETADEMDDRMDEPCELSEAPTEDKEELTDEAREEREAPAPVVVAVVDCAELLDAVEAGVAVDEPAAAGAERVTPTAAHWVEPLPMAACLRRRDRLSVVESISGNVCLQVGGVSAGLLRGRQSA